MYALSNFILAGVFVLDKIFSLMMLLVIVRALISWVSPDPFNPIVQLIRKTTEPVLYPVRKLLPFSNINGLDLSPMIAVFILLFLQRWLVPTLTRWGYSMGG